MVETNLYWQWQVVEQGAAATNFTRKVVAGNVFGVWISWRIVHYCNKLPRGPVESLFLETFKTCLDKAMARHVLVLAGDWNRDF